jgi:hypothetical protein
MHEASSTENENQHQERGKEEAQTAKKRDRKKCFAGKYFCLVSFRFDYFSGCLGEVFWVSEKKVL